MGTEDKQKDGEEVAENAGAPTQSSSQESAGSGAGSETHKGYVTEESYKGLQRVAEKQKAKLETELAQLRQRLEQQAADLEEAKLAVAEKASLETQQKELNTSITALQAERDRLTRQLNQQKMILADFPDLASLASYIPLAETDDDYKANAQAFRAALQLYLKSAVRDKFGGAAPPIDGGNESHASDATDKLWNEVYRLAGVPGKEQEYEEAYAKLQDALKSQQ